jgi:hypothetical protein
MNKLISMFHFRLHNSTAHLSNVLKLSRSFENQWNLLCWKYKINEFYFGTNTKFTNLWINKLVIFNQTTKIDTHEEKYFHSISNFSSGGHIWRWVDLSDIVLKENRQMTIPLNFGTNWFCRFRGVDKKCENLMPTTAWDGKWWE